MNRVRHWTTPLLISYLGNEAVDHLPRVVIIHVLHRLVDSVLREFQSLASVPDVPLQGVAPCLGTPHQERRHV